MDFTGGGLLMLIGPDRMPLSFRHLETVLPREATASEISENAQTQHAKRNMTFDSKKSNKSQKLAWVNGM